MHDLGTLIWAILVIIGVITSIVRNAQRANARRQAASPPVAPAPVGAQPAAPQVHRQFVARIQPAAEVPPVIPPPSPPLAKGPSKGSEMPPVIAPPEPLVAPVRTASPIRGMFDSKPALVRAIVAAQVLGPPLALQEHLIWSPRQNVPSI